MKKSKWAILFCFGVVGLLLTLAAVLVLSTEKETVKKKLSFWIQHRLDDQLGSGSTNDPYNGKRVDEVIAEIKRQAPKDDDKVWINFGRGRFETKGIAPGLNWRMSGRGMRDTVLALKDVGDDSFHHVNVYVVSSAYYGRSNDPSWLDYFEIRDLTLDCQWPLQSARKDESVRYGGVHANVSEGKVVNVRVINWGSNGLSPASSEVFPIFLETYSAENTFVLIEGCEVEEQHQYQGGYATAIMVQTMQPGAGDRIPEGTRQSLAGIVRNNRAVGIYGHGYGCGRSENVVFLDNVAVGCKTGFNCDTGHNRGIEISRNRFELCNQGVHVGNPSSGDFRDFRITENFIELNGPWVNEFLTRPRTEYSYGLRLAKQVRNCEFQYNRMWVSDKSLKQAQSLATGYYGVGSVDSVETVGLKNGNNQYEGMTGVLAENPSVYYGKQ